MREKFVGRANTADMLLHDSHKAAKVGQSTVHEGAATPCRQAGV